MRSGENKTAGGYGTWDDVSPLFISAEGSEELIVQDLIEAGASVNQTNAVGQSALHVISMQRDGSYSHFSTRFHGLYSGVVQIMRILITNGADINLQDKKGRTPLHYACEHGNLHLVNMLLDDQAQTNVRDLNGFSALELAAKDYFDVMQTLLQRCNFTNQETIQAYEIVVSSDTCNEKLDCLQKAFFLRNEHNIQKKVCEPLECHGFATECDNLDDLETFKDNIDLVRLQGVLARERIFKGRPMNIVGHMDYEIVNAIEEGDLQRLNALLMRTMYLFEQNKEYLYFIDVFLWPYKKQKPLEFGHSLWTLVKSNFELLETSSVVKIIEVSIECCQTLQDKLQAETKPSAAMQTVSDFERMLLTICGLISKLRKRNRVLDNINTIEKLIAENYLKQLSGLFPEVSSTVTNHKISLVHLLCSNNYYIHLNSPYNYELMKLLISLGTLNINAVNTALHFLIQTMLQDLVCYSRTIFMHINDMIHSLCQPMTDAERDLMKLYRKILANEKFLKGQPSFPNVTTSLQDQLLANAEKIVHLLLQSGVYLHARNNMRKTVFDILHDFKLPEDEVDSKKVVTRIMEVLHGYIYFPTLKKISANTIHNCDIPYQELLPEQLSKFVSMH